MNVAKSQKNIRIQFAQSSLHVLAEGESEVKHFNGENHWTTSIHTSTTYRVVGLVLLLVLLNCSHESEFGFGLVTNGDSWVL